MKKPYLKTVIAASILSGAIITHAQSGGGGAGGAAGGSAAGSAGGAGVGAAAGSAGAGSGIASPGSGGQAGVAAGTGAAASGTGQSSTVAPGAASINQPANIAPGTGASITEISPNTARGTLSGAGIASPSTVAPGQSTATTVGAAGNAGQTTALNSVPNQVQNALQSFSANGQLGALTQVAGPNGTTYRATVTQNGVPMELELAPNGRVLSRTPVTGSAAGTLAGRPTGSTLANQNANQAAGALGNTEAGLPLSSLPATLQNNIANRLGNAEIQAISRDQSANGDTFRVTANQNGVPTEYQFSANGTLLSATPITGSATSAAQPGVAGAVDPTVGGGGTVLLDRLPADLRDTIGAQTGNGQIRNIRQQQLPGGPAYIVSYDSNGRPMTMVIDANGRVISNRPTAVGGAAPGATGSGSNSNTNQTTSSIDLDDLPDAVEEALKEEEPDARIRHISKSETVSGDRYLVRYETDDGVGNLEIGADGRIIRDSRDVPVIAVGPKAQSESGARTMQYQSLPVAAKNAVRAYATMSDVQSVSLGRDRDGKTVYDIVFYRDGRRDRMILEKDGTLVRIEENVAPAVAISPENPTPKLAVGDLPQAVQDTIRRQSDDGMISEIETRQVGDQSAYVVHMRGELEDTELLVAQDGVIIQPVGSDVSDRTVAVPAESDEEPAPAVRTVNTASAVGTTSAAEDSGTAPSTERGTSTESEADNGDVQSSSEQEVRLSDVPSAVQKAAKEIAGRGIIESINPKLNDSGVAYEINYVEGEEKKAVRVNKDGERIEGENE